jgi:hypothetical protein
MSAGADYSIALRSDGTIAAFGANTFNQLNVPALPPGLRYTSIDAGGLHALALRSDGTLVAWGDDQFTQTQVPALPAGLSYTGFVAGGYHSLARRSDGSVVGWGTNFNGQTTIPALSIGTDVVGLAAGTSHSLAIVTSSTATLSATIAASRIPSSGLATISVVNPTPIGGTSTPLVVAIRRPVPILTSISPSNVALNALPTLVTLTGSGFDPASRIAVDGTFVDTTYVSATSLSFTASAALFGSTGARNISVFNPGPIGGTSANQPLQVNNPAPTLTAVNPNSGAPGVPLTLVLTGTGFSAQTSVLWKGSTSGVSITGITATSINVTVAAAVNGTTGSATIAVQNPAPGGGTASSSVSIANPAPTLASITPATFLVGSAPSTLSLSGTGFSPFSIVRLGTTDLATTFVSQTTLTAALPAASVATAGIRTVSVFNPAPGGGTSLGSNLSVTNPAPTASAVTPTTVLAGSDQVLTFTGTGFNSQTTVTWNGSTTGVTTNVTSATSLTATLAASLIPTATTGTVAVVNPAPGGGTTATTSITVNHPSPILLTVAPATFLLNAPPATITLTGSGFDAASVVRLDTTNLVTTYVSGTTLTAVVPPSLVANAGLYFIRVFNPTPGGGTSASRTLTAQNLVPTVTAIAPSTFTAGTAATATITGTNYTPQTSVLWNGAYAGISVTGWTPTTLTVAISASNLADAGTASVVVVNPTPGGGSSAPTTVTIESPAPVLSSVSPTAFFATSPPATLNIIGSGFGSTTVVRWDGTDLRRAS